MQPNGRFDQFPYAVRLTPQKTLFPNDVDPQLSVIHGLGVHKGVVIAKLRKTSTVVIQRREQSRSGRFLIRSLRGCGQFRRRQQFRMFEHPKRMFHFETERPVLRSGDP